MTKADRLWLRRQLQLLREEIDRDHRKALNDTLAEEARSILLDHFISQQNRQTPSS